VNFFDTSIYVAASLKNHEQHRACLDLLERHRLKREPMACGAHSMSELYSVLTRIPPPNRLSAKEAFAIVERIASHTKLISLKSGEELEVLRDAASRNLVSGIVHDAGLLACARKAEAREIYTLNMRHFQLVAPDLRERILHP
jgi:predicted nucleic acid-binding protein